MVIGIIPNTEKEGCLRFMRGLTKWLTGHGITPVMDKKAAMASGYPAYVGDERLIYAECAL